MKLVELTAVKGGPLWVNAALVLYVAGAEAAGASLYGDNNVRTSSRLWFAQGVSLEVKESVGEIVERFAG
ncbi:hypothetical protein ACO2Q3_11685 [Caulobacter sp. KR2-114]|uniref:hypothetical protein n=1 Tax=Caulobacter sp. KR2-114 TaxID=3400912 RepID=UPI003C0D4136